MTIEIIDYDPAYAADFTRLNIAWLERFFVVEPYDAQVLNNPQPYILDAGGEILFAKDTQSGAIIGVIALIMRDGGTIEISKMAVDESAQGAGIGKMLLHAAIERAKAYNPPSLYLLTSSSLEVANHLYKKLGFVSVPLHEGDTKTYARCNLRYEYPLDISRCG